MCVIFACEDKFPTKQNLKDAELMNDDGAGVAWLDNKKRVHFVKGIDGLTIYKMIKSKELKLPCIIHFRIASSGTTSKGLTHPFIISTKSPIKLKGVLPKESDGVLFHNGTISDHEDLLKKHLMLSQNKMLKGEISDSRVMAFITALYGHDFINLISEGWNKYAVLDSKGIHKYGNWGFMKKGLQHSNNYYECNFYGSMYTNESEDFKNIDGMTEYGLKGAYQDRFYSHGMNRGFEEDLYTGKNTHSITNHIEDSDKDYDNHDSTSLTYDPTKIDKDVDDEIALGKFFDEECADKIKQNKLNEKPFYSCGKKATKKEVREMNISFLIDNGWKKETLENKSNKYLNTLVENEQLSQANKLKTSNLLKAKIKQTEKNLKIAQDKLKLEKINFGIPKSIKYTIEQYEEDYKDLIIKTENKTAFSEALKNV